MNLLRRADHQRVPWKNGQGVTYEVARAADVWRLSFAEVDRAGAFSSFPGVDRIITLAVGHELKLTVDGAAQVLRPSSRSRFRAKPRCGRSPRRRRSTST